MHGADQHGLFGALSDDARDLPNFDARQESGFFVQIIGHRGKPRGDDAACVIAAFIHDVECHRRAKIDNNRRRTEKMFHRDSIGEPIGTDGCRSGIIDSDPGQRGRVQFDRIESPKAFDHAAHLGCGPWNDTAQRSAFESSGPSKFPDPLLGASVRPMCGRNVRVPDDGALGRNPEVRMGVADVEQKYHFRRMTSPPITRSRCPC